MAACPSAFGTTSERTEAKWDLDQLAARPDALPRVAELIEAHHGSSVLVELMEVKIFAELLPTRAHRAIAWLMLEGAVEEVLTTNYDTCLERAFADSYGRGLRVVHDRASYRRKSGEARLLKLNGCAKASDPGAIALTDRSLQAWHSAPWVVDVFRDRCRSCHLVYSGFGLDEAQIRHPAVALSHEVEPRTKDLKPWNRWDAPWVQGYGEQPTFPQLQVLLAHTTQHGGRADEAGSNFIGGSDAPYYARDGACKVLSADDFWGAIWQGWCAAWVRSHLLHAPPEAVDELIRDLFGADGEVAPRQPRLDVDGPRPDLKRSFEDEQWIRFDDHADLHLALLLVSAYATCWPTVQWRLVSSRWGVPTESRVLVPAKVGEPTTEVIVNASVLIAEVLSQLHSGVSPEANNFSSATRQALVFLQVEARSRSTLPISGGV